MPVNNQTPRLPLCCVMSPFSFILYRQERNVFSFMENTTEATRFRNSLDRSGRPSDKAS